MCRFSYFTAGKTQPSILTTAAISPWRLKRSARTSRSSKSRMSRIVIRSPVGINIKSPISSYDQRKSTLDPASSREPDEVSLNVDEGSLTSYTVAVRGSACLRFLASGDSRVIAFHGAL